MTQPSPPAPLLVVRPHWRAFGVWYLSMAVLALGPLNNPQAVLKPWPGVMLAGLIGLAALLKARSSVLTVTAGQVEVRGGLLGRAPRKMALQDLDHVRVLAGLTQRLLGVGVLHLVPRGAGRVITFWGVAEPQKIKAEIEGLAGLRPGR